MSVCLSKPIRFQQGINQWDLIPNDRISSRVRFSGSRNPNLKLVFQKNFFIDFFTQRMGFFAKRIFFIRLHRRVIGVKELESGVSFSKKFFYRLFYTKDGFFCKKNFFYKASPKGNRGQGTRIRCQFFKKIFLSTFLHKG